MLGAGSKEQWAGDVRMDVRAVGGTGRGSRNVRSSISLKTDYSKLSCRGLPGISATTRASDQLTRPAISWLKNEVTRAGIACGVVSGVRELATRCMVSLHTRRRYVVDDTFPQFGPATKKLAPYASIVRNSLAHWEAKTPST